MTKRLARLSLMIYSILLSTDRAQAFLEINTFYYSQAMNSGTASTSSRMFAEVCLGFAIDKDSKYLLGWNYAIFNVADNSGSSTSTYASTQMGPRFVWFFTKSRTFSLGLAYHIVTTANYDPGSPGTAALWSGTALKADFSYNVPISESWLVGLRLNYSSASYTSQLVGSTTYTTTAYTASYIYPSVYLMWVF